MPDAYLCTILYEQISGNNRHYTAAASGKGRATKINKVGRGLTY